MGSSGSEGKAPQVHDIMKQARGRMDIAEALNKLDGKLPEDVASLVKMTASHQGKSHSDFAESSLQKARRILNDMMFTAFEDLDEVIIECKEFHERNRGTWKQVTNDMARLQSQITAFREIEVQASTGIQEISADIRTTEEAKAKMKAAYWAQRLIDDHEFQIRTNDLAVFDFVMNISKCNGPLFKLGDNAVLLQKEAPQVGVCETKGGLELHFNNPALQVKIERMMTPDARKALQMALGQVKQALIQTNASVTTAVNTTTVGQPVYSMPTEATAEEPDASGQWKKCTNDFPVNCGLLHDIMSLEWGKFRDLYDALKMKIKLDYEEYLRLLEDFNLQLQTLTNQKSKYEEVLANAIAQIQTDQQAMKEKEVERDDLQGEWEKKCAEYRAEITEILYTRICATRKVRDEVMTYSTV